MRPPRYADELPRLKMSTELSQALMEHSPRLVISRPTLIRVADSPTGWLVVEPDPT